MSIVNADIILKTSKLESIDKILTMER